MKFIKVAIQVLFIAFLTSCGGGAVPNISYQPIGVPVSISIDANGNIGVEWQGSLQTPIGSFSVGVNVDPAQMFPQADGTLTVRIDGQDVIYDLSGNDNINIKLESGYYEEVNLEKNGKNWFFEVVRISNGSSDSNGQTSSIVSSGAPVFERIDQHENYYGGELVINDDIYFNDSNGDAYAIEYDLVSVVPEISGVQVQNDSIDSSADQQRVGTYKTITWECGSNNKTYTVTLRGRIVDRSGYQSDPFNVVFACR
jgi:hypothetical protein